MINILKVLILMALLFPGTANAQVVTNILTVSGIQFVEKGEPWNYGSGITNIRGLGSLTFTNGLVSPPIDVTYEGQIFCEVTAHSLVAQPNNKVDMSSTVQGNDIDAKTKSGTLTISNCRYTNATTEFAAITESFSASGVNIKIEIEGLFGESGGMFGVVEISIKGKVASGLDPRVRLELIDALISNF